LDFSKLFQVPILHKIKIKEIYLGSRTIAVTLPDDWILVFKPARKKCLYLGEDYGDSSAVSEVNNAGRNVGCKDGIDEGSQR
jgi:hypothetical protein